MDNREDRYPSITWTRQKLQSAGRPTKDLLDAAGSQRLQEGRLSQTLIKQLNGFIQTSSNL